MNFKIKNRKLLNADTISPEIVYAEFSDQLAPGEAERMANSLNRGHEMLMIYDEMRDSLHIVNVVDMLKRMEDVYNDWVNETHRIRRSVK